MSNNPRSTYTAAFKLQVVAHAEATGNRVAGREFGVNESVIRRWRKFKTQYENLEDKETRKSIKKGTLVPIDARLSSVGVIACDNYPEEVTVKIELNPVMADQDSSAIQPIELSDIVCCSRHMEGNLSLLASAMDMTDEDMDQLKSKYKSTPGQALQLLKIWQKNIGGSRLELSKLLSSAGFSKAAESLTSCNREPST